MLQDQNQGLLGQTPLQFFGQLIADYANKLDPSARKPFVQYAEAQMNILVQQLQATRGEPEAS